MNDRLFVDYISLTCTDFPNTIAAILFTKECDCRCPYCHNLKRLSKLDYKSNDEIFSFLDQRKKMIDGIVITGGEPLLPKNVPGLISFLSKVKSLGFKIKIDTNGNNPASIRKLAELKLIDYIAMDIKTELSIFPWLRKEITETKDIYLFFNVNVRECNTTKSFMIINDFNLDYELRTTMVKPFITHHGLIKVASFFYELNSKKIKNWFLQIPNLKDDIVLNESYKMSKFNTDELSLIKKDLKGYVKNIDIR